MKNVLIPFVLLSLSIVVPSVQSAPAISLGKTYELALPGKFEPAAVGVRDLKEGEWLSGFETDLVWFKRKDEDRPIGYFAPNWLFNAGQKWKGSVGGALGINSGKAGSYIANAVGLTAPAQARRFDWLLKFADFVSIEGALGYRIHEVPADRSRLIYGFGGKLRVPLKW